MFAISIVCKTKQAFPALIKKNSFLLVLQKQIKSIIKSGYKKPVLLLKVET